MSLINPNVLRSIIAALFMLLVGGAAWEINRLSGSIDKLDTTMSTTSRELTKAVGSVRDELITTNGKLDTMSAMLNGRLDTIAAKLDGTNQRLDDLKATSAKKP